MYTQGDGKADASAAAGRSEDDRGFWDRQAPAQPPQQAQAQGAPQATQGPQTGRTASSQPPQPAAPAPSATALQLPPLPAPVSTAGKHSVTSLEELQRGLADAAGLQQQGMELRS
ncbi:hypothetical protein HaLaN_20831, partial [Haematococcus lacustris]